MTDMEIRDIVDYKEGTVYIKMYNCNQNFLPGDKVKIRISAKDIWIMKVTYWWRYDWLYKKDVLMLFNNGFLKTIVPTIRGNKPVLHIRIKFMSKDGSKREYTHTFKFNSGDMQ